MKLLKLALFAILVPSLAWSQLYVSTNGSDANDGSSSKPMATVHMALRKAREMRRLNDPLVKDGIHIYISGGTYPFEEPLFIRPEDAGTTGPTTIEALPNEKPVFDGGRRVVGWKKILTPVTGLPKQAQGKVWVADAPVTAGNVIDFRQLWVNEKKAIRARDKNADSMARILSWNKKTEQCWIPKPSADISNVNGLEMFIHQWWAIAILRVKSVQVRGDSALLSFYQPESRIQSEHPWPAPWISTETGNSAFYLTNALQLLDEPGEWYLDKRNQKIYYWPRNDDNMNSATVVVPSLETLVRIEGNIDHPVTNISFKGISFQHTTWLRPSQQGHVALQAGMYFLDAYKLKTPGTPDKKSLENQAWLGRPDAAVEVNWSSGIVFENCRFEHLASTGLDYNKGVKDSRVTGNLFKDIGGSAGLFGVFSEESTEAHLPYQPSHEKELTERLEVSNNLINDAANEDWGCVGIGAGYIRNSFINHNDISDVPYTGISIGWGWTKTENVMRNNFISSNKIQRYGRQLYDVAAIYTLSAQPGTFIVANYIDSIYKAPYAHIPSHWFYLYTDEGTSGVTVKNNWTPSQKFLQNANGPDNVWENNGPMVNDSFKTKAGLQEKYRHLLKERASYNRSFAINRELSVIIELVAAGNFDVKMLQQVLKDNSVDPNAIYQWQNHYVVFDKVKDAMSLKGKIQNTIPGVNVKVYYDAFYDFNRMLCPDTTTVKELDHIILTANLVDNPKLQKEYMDYHATQFEKWPELSRGFCNASFQQLLLYRSGRQLMLVISIPKGESLDKLNPRTWENNPRVNDWNKMMAKYQEGIEGTKKGETWVFLNKL